MSSNPLQNLRGDLQNAQTFDDLFVLKRQIVLKVHEVIGEITQLEVAKDGNMLIVDRLTKKTWLFDQDGNFKKDIDATNEFPGIKWLPEKAWFLENNFILVRVDQTHNLFLFDHTGEFVKAIPVRFPFQFRSVVTNNAEYFYAYSILPNEFAVKKLDLEGKILKTGGIFPVKYKNFIDRSSGGGVVTDSRGYLYQYNECSPEIHKLSPELKLLQTFKRTPSYYRMLPEDFPEHADNPAIFMKKVNQLLTNSTTTLAVHLWAENLLFIQYAQLGKNAISLDICDLEGNYFIDKKISYDTPIVAVNGVLLYKILEPSENGAGDTSNPIIQEFIKRH